MGADTSPGVGPSESINTYWTVGEGRAKWADSPHPYTTLVALLSKYVSNHIAHGLAAEYYHRVFGKWPGAHHKGH
jgi:hypothetical protein